MKSIDLNLLVALDVLLSERSVTRAARRLGLSASAMSRTLARLRSATGDPLLVQAGRSLVATPYAETLVDHVHALAREAQAVLSPAPASLDLATLDRCFTIRANEGFLARFSARLVAAVAEAAPNVRLRFAPKPDKDAAPLREGPIDLEVGVMGASAPEVRAQLIFRDAFVGAVRVGHPLLDGPISAERYAGCRHVVASRRGAFSGPVDDALAELGLRRRVAAVVPGFPDALRIASQTDLVALAPRSSFDGADPFCASLESFELPVRTPQIAISAMWHPRMDADPGHRWLRDTVTAVCRA
ncbi:LysR family transcriptional regulator [Phenylobacterium sp.]|uniref:LysR family transcriptional regulator n=1 Tax=Phenylobacterium sp. TaxID=1871053 RepID=UPI0035B36C8F